MTPAEIEAETARLRDLFLSRGGGAHGWHAVAEASLRAREDQVAALRAEVDAALAWHAGGARPNHPPELAGCPPSALRAILRMLPKETT